MNGLRADAVRVLAPRIYEGGDKSSAHWYRGENELPTTKCQIKSCLCVSGSVLSAFFGKICIGRAPPGFATPLTSAGGKASIHPRALTALQIPIYLTAYESRFTVFSCRSAPLPQGYPLCRRGSAGRKARPATEAPGRSGPPPRRAGRKAYPG